MDLRNVAAKDLKSGDQVRVTVMGGEEYLEVEAVDPNGMNRDHEPRVFARLHWGPHVPIEPFWDDFAPDEELTVRRSSWVDSPFGGVEVGYDKP
jgi:hypothetical protein